MESRASCHIFYSSEYLSVEVYFWMFISFVYWHKPYILCYKKRQLNIFTIVAEE